MTKPINSLYNNYNEKNEHEKLAMKKKNRVLVTIKFMIESNKSISSKKYIRTYTLCFEQHDSHTTDANRIIHELNI